MKELSGAALGYLEDEGFLSGFCRDCEGIRRIPGGGCSPGEPPALPAEETCPADFDPGSRRCIQRERYLEIRETLKGVDELWRPAA